MNGDRRRVEILSSYVMRACVRAERRRAWVLLVTRARFIMSDDINHKDDSTKWRNRYEPDLSLVIRLEEGNRGRGKERDRENRKDRMRSPK